MAIRLVFSNIYIILPDEVSTEYIPYGYGLRATSGKFVPIVSVELGVKDVELPGIPDSDYFFGFPVCDLNGEIYIHTNGHD